MKVLVRNRDSEQDTVFHNVKKANQRAVRNQENELVTVEKYDGTVDKIEDGYIEWAENVKKCVYSVDTPTLHTRPNVDKISVIPYGIKINHNEQKDVVETREADNNENNMIKRVFGE